MRYYIVWLRNNTDIRDDEPIKVKAESVEDAKRIATPYLRNRFSFRGVYTMPEFKKLDPWWHSHFWGQKAVNE
jgi:hypothetical protein